MGAPRRDQHPHWGASPPERCLSISHPQVGPCHVSALRFGYARLWEGGKSPGHLLDTQAYPTSRHLHSKSIFNLE